MPVTLPMDPRRGRDIVREMEKPFRHLAQGPPCLLPSNPMKQQQGLRQVHLTSWEEGRDGASQEDSWLSLCIRAQAGHKRRVLHLGGGRLGTMQTQRASLSLGRWSLWLLLLGLALPSASAQALSYREAVLRAVDQLNERSSEANLYRLLELDPPPKDVSCGGGRGQALLLPALATLLPLHSGCTSCQEGTFPSRWVPTSSRKPSQTWVISQHQASCLSISAVGTGALHTWLRLPGLLGAPGMGGSQAL